MLLNIQQTYIHTQTILRINNEFNRNKFVKRKLFRKDNGLYPRHRAHAVATQKRLCALKGKYKASPKERLLANRYFKICLKFNALKLQKKNYFYLQRMRSAFAMCRRCCCSSAWLSVTFCVLIFPLPLCQ